ncbi:MAG: DUF4037 domain-containing protein [Oscillospiraceae bacterium]|nr:DUF4037 domain-containing protein [Oscillospiraceae bacterium]
MVDKLFKELCALEEVEALALGGSRAGALYDEASDYDVYLYCTRPIPEDTRKHILSQYCCHMEIGNHFWEYEDNCRLNNGIDIDILYRDLDAFAEGVAEVVERFQPHNSYTTCMWHNLLTCKVVYDRDGRLTRIKERFSVPYPRQLKENIMARGWQLLHTAMPAYDAQLAKAVKRGDLVSVNHRTAGFLETYFDLLFAMNELTHPGEKRLIQICRERCRRLPAHFEENLERLFADLYQAPRRVAETIAAILSELEQVDPWG